MHNYFEPCLVFISLNNLIFDFLTFAFSDANAFIVPQEVPSLLSLVYSNIPPIKKGKSFYLKQIQVQNSSDTTQVFYPYKT